MPFPPPGDLPDPGIKPGASYIGRQILYHVVTREAPSCMYAAAAKNNFFACVEAKAYLGWVTEPIREVEIMGQVYLLLTSRDGCL